MPSPATRRVTMLVVIGAALAAPLHAAPLTPQQRKEISALAKQALSTDVATSEKGIEALKAYGDAAKPRLLSVLNQLLTQGRTIILQAKRRISDPSKAKKLEENITKTRADALANIAVLEKGKPVELAHEYYDKLKPMLELLGKVNEVRRAVYRLMKRRAGLYALWQELGGDDRRFSPDNEKMLTADAEAILGVSVEAVGEIPEFGQGEPPEKGSTAWHLWFDDACRRIEAYNSALKGKMSAGEARNVRILNAYREMLGILPLEVDPRLLQSARRHSKEMVALGYFSHTSPKPENKTHTMRMKNAGYDRGSSENIAAGRSGGDSTFWMWFDSPGHHKNMAGAGSAAIGVGKWGSTWTQNFGRGKRLMLLHPDERKKAVVKGQILTPGGTSSTYRRSSTIGDTHPSLP